MENKPNLQSEHFAVSADEWSAERAGELFDAEYYRVGCGPVPYDRSQPCWRDLFGSIAQELIRSLRPRRVLDAGCALGFLVEAFWDRGVEAYGIDVSPFAIGQVRRDLQPFCYLCSLGDDFPIELRELGKFDLVTCIEVLEHMLEPDARNAVRRLTEITDTIVFSSHPSDLEEKTHFNVKPLIYWLQLFQEHHFSPDLEFDASFIAPHAMMLRRRDHPFTLDILRTFTAVLTARQQNVARQGQINDCTERNSQHVNNLNDLRRVHDELATQYAEQQTLLGDAKREHDALAIRYAEQQAILEVLQRNKTADVALQRIADMQEQFDRVIREVESTKRAHDLLVAQFAEQQPILESLQQTIPIHEADVQRIAEKQKQFEQTYRQLDTAKPDLSLLQAEYAAVNERQGAWDHSLQRMKQDVDRLWQESRDQLTELSTSNRTQFGDIRGRLSQVEHQVRGMLDSRIWQFLVRGGRIVMKLSGRWIS